jgi:four helix bundle protein
MSSEFDLELDGNSANGSTSYTELNVWSEARAITKEIYAFTSNFPESEKQGLSKQMRELAVTVPSKIAEGAGRRQAKHALHYLFEAKGSLFQLETMVYIALDLGYCLDYQANDLIEKIITSRKLLFGYIRFKERKAENQR